MNEFEEYRKLQDELIKIQREARKAMEGVRPRLAVEGLREEIALWEKIRAEFAADPLDTKRVIELLLAAETLEQAKKKSFYM